MEYSCSLPVQGNLQIKYRIWRCDSPQGLVVLLHGVASNMTRWSEFVERTTLKDQWDILRIDLRGHGDSLWRGKLNMEIWCSDLLEVLDKERCQRAVIIGHSLGAQIAVHFASWYPSRTTGLVLIDPILGSALLGGLRLVRRFSFLLNLAVAVIRLINRLGIYRRYIPARDLRILDEQMRRELLVEGHVEEMVKRYASPWPDLKNFPTANFLQEIVQMARPLPDLSSVAAPVLVVLSNGVTYTDPEATREEIARLQQPTIETIDAYHWPLTEKPDETRHVIENWLAVIDST